MGETQASAYRTAVSDKGTPESTWASASRLAADVKVQVRVRELLAQVHGQVVEALAYGYEEAMAELTALQRAAFVRGDFGAVNTAIARKCKISGLDVDPRQNSREPFADASDEEVDAEIAKAQTEIKQHGAGTRH